MTERADAARAAQRLGMRRVYWVRVRSDAGGAFAEAYGIGHRIPRVIRIPLSLAAELAASGVPLLGERVDTPVPGKKSA